SWTASRRNSGGYGGLMGGIDSSLPESFDPSGQVSSKPGEDHTPWGVLFRYDSNPDTLDRDKGLEAATAVIGLAEQLTR
ncbi:MAG: hypothetical protein WA687_09765, partial [Solirubrobacterales bacterium]